MEGELEEDFEAGYGECSSHCDRVSREAAMKPGHIDPGSR